jgi:predicted nucleic acid-binding protein
MRIAVTDANIFIDLIKLQWLGYLFSIEVEIYATIEVIDELNENQLERVTAFIQSQQLRVHHFSTEELEQVMAINAPLSLTTQDKSVVYLAKKLDASVLSGDNPLRKFCEKQQLEVKGIIWLFDRFLQLQLITHEIAITQMNYLLSFNNRLPAIDCQARLKEWKEKL